MSIYRFILNFPTEINSKEDLAKHILKTKNIFYYDGKNMSKRELSRILYLELESMSKRECLETISDFSSIRRLLFDVIYDDKKLGTYCKKTWVSETNNVFKRHFLLTRKRINFEYAKNKYGGMLEDKKYYKLDSDTDDPPPNNLFYKELLKEFIIKEGIR